MITELEPNQIFVFGSNLAGIHGAGAAKIAHEKFDAEWGIGEGIIGRCYAIPTKDHNIETRSLIDINKSVGIFLNYATAHPEFEFLVTAIGCGLAGYEPWQIAPLFAMHPSNVILPGEFKEITTKIENLRIATMLMCDIGS